MDPLYPDYFEKNIPYPPWIFNLCSSLVSTQKSFSGNFASMHCRQDNILEKKISSFCSNWTIFVILKIDNARNGPKSKSLSILKFKLKTNPFHQLFHMKYTLAKKTRNWKIFFLKKFQRQSKF